MSSHAPTPTQVAHDFVRKQAKTLAHDLRRGYVRPQEAVNVFAGWCSAAMLPFSPDGKEIWDTFVAEAYHEAEEHPPKHRRSKAHRHHAQAILSHDAMGHGVAADEPLAGSVARDKSGELDYGD